MKTSWVAAERLDFSLRWRNFLHYMKLGRTGLSRRPGQQCLFSLFLSWSVRVVTRDAGLGWPEMPRRRVTLLEEASMPTSHLCCVSLGKGRETLYRPRM